jgi:hypothetical protein
MRSVPLADACGSVAAIRLPALFHRLRSRASRRAREPTRPEVFRPRTVRRSSTSATLQPASTSATSPESPAFGHRACARCSESGVAPIPRAPGRDLFPTGGSPTEVSRARGGWAFALPRSPVTNPRGQFRTRFSPTRSARTPLVVRPLQRRLEAPGWALRTPEPGIDAAGALGGERRRFHGPTTRARPLTGPRTCRCALLSQRGAAGPLISAFREEVPRFAAPEVPFIDEPVTPRQQTPWRPLAWNPNDGFRRCPASPTGVIPRLCPTWG